MTLSIDTLASTVRSTPAAKGHAKSRTAVRFDRREVRRLDVLCAQLDNASRAALVRALVRWGLDAIDAVAPATTEGGDP